MFSLGSLVAQASGETSPRRELILPQGDDSGLIDLKALTEQMNERETAPPVTAHVPVFPFGAPEPPPAPEAAPASVPKPRGKAGKKAWFAAALVAVLASGVAIGASARPKVEPLALGQRAAPAFEMAAKQAAAIPVEPPPAVIAAPEKPEPVASKEASSPAPRAITRSRTWQKTGKSQVDKTPKTKVETKTPPPPAEPCDLMCQMRRATQRK